MGAAFPAASVLSTTLRKGKGLKTPDAAFMFSWPAGYPSWAERAVDRTQSVDASAWLEEERKVKGRSMNKRDGTSRDRSKV